MTYREPASIDDYEIRAGSIVRIVHDSNHSDQALVGYEVRVSRYHSSNDPPDTIHLCYGSLHGTIRHPKSDVILVRPASPT